MDMTKKKEEKRGVMVLLRYAKVVEHEKMFNG